MFVSYNRLKELVDFNLNPEELGELLTILGLEVEEIIDFKKKYDKFFTAEVLSCEKHPNADKLSLCEVSIGNEQYSIVCGAPNVAQGQKVVLGTNGAVVPSAGFMLEKRKIRGFESNGMICSQTELETGDDASGIWVLPEDTEIGKPLAEYLDMDDTIIELSITPNNADCLSHLGVAREIGAYFGRVVNYPKVELDETGGHVNDSAKVTIEAADKCPRYTARVIRNTKTVESPTWLKNYLIKLGLRPINLPVDVTNYVLMEIGQPMHAFDLDTLAGNEIIVKNAKDGDNFTTLDDKERKLDSSMLMICDAEKPVAVGGVMGGQNSEISDNTKNILLESAYFDPSSVRKTSKKLGILSDSSYRFERGVDPGAVPLALDIAAKLIVEYGGGEIQKEIIDEYPNKVDRGNVKLRYDRVSYIIGAEIDKEMSDKILTALQFEQLSSDDNESEWKIPSFRVDVSHEIDLIEDIARHYSYTKIEPQYDSILNFGKTGVPDALRMPELRKVLRDYFVSRGINEILTQNIIDPKSAEMFSDNPVKISNPLGEEMSRMRPSLIPSILKVILNNVRVGTYDLSFFEFGKTFNYSSIESAFVKGFEEQENLIIALTGNAAPRQWGKPDREVDFYDAKGIVEELIEYLKADELNIEIQSEPEQGFSANSMAIKNGNDILGHFGEIDPKICKNFDIDFPVYAIYINAKKLFSLEAKSSIYKKVAPFPGMQRDLAFVVDKETKAGEIQAVINNFGGKFLKDISIFDVYEGKGIEEGKKSIAYNLHFSSPERTLKESEIEGTINKIIKEVKKQFEAELRS
jgi:phenylalanyl-tRNA synthetase beta chain